MKKTLAIASLAAMAFTGGLASGTSAHAASENLVTVTGHVEDENGKALAHHKLQVGQADMKHGGLSKHTNVVTDKKGNYRVKVKAKQVAVENRGNGKKYSVAGTNPRTTKSGKTYTINLTVDLKK
jgi:protocatechuate 3,4-dioxygenase beta subunit